MARNKRWDVVITMSKYVILWCNIIIFSFACPFREGSDSEPVVKKRKTASVVTDQPCQDNKVAVDSVPDNTLDQDQVIPFEFMIDTEIILIFMMNT